MKIVEGSWREIEDGKKDIMLADPITGNILLKISEELYSKDPFSLTYEQMKKPKVLGAFLVTAGLMIVHNGSTK